MRGQAAKVGDTRTSQNGYHYTKCEGGWRLTHHLVAEKKLGRKMTKEDLVKFADGDRTNLKPDNIIVVEKGTSSLRRRKAILEARIEELQAELLDIEHQLIKG